MANYYITIGETKFDKYGKHVIDEMCKRLENKDTIETFKVCAEVFLEEYKSYLFERKEG